MKIISFLLLMTAHYVCSLTTSELSQFTNGVTIDTTGATNYVFSATGLPDHATQTVNPHTATAKNYNFQIPKTGTAAASPICLPMGIIGFVTNGVAYFSALQNQGYNAVEGDYAETFDRYGISI